MELVMQQEGGKAVQMNKEGALRTGLCKDSGNASVIIHSRNYSKLCGFREV